MSSGRYRSRAASCRIGSGREEPALEITTIGFWIAAAATFVLSAWTILAAIVEVARGKSRPWHPDVLLAILFHGGTAVLALWLAGKASHGG